MSTEGRPLSPHLTIYRWPITMTLSILHRMTGIAMSVGLVLFVAWLAAIAWPAVPYEGLDRFFDSGPGRLLLLGWCFSFFFHLANGIRHLLWDTGRLLEKSQAATSSWFVIVSAVLMTAVYWLSV
ncbi:MAG: succinate dehydrogenase, cytochrome b556 subunit [Gammaproteobacteria bacterium]|nr:succinate dehydrogenase, cytochrome b556 subunit [Gammaproteobacteria bacterium]